MTHPITEAASDTRPTPPPPPIFMRMREVSALIGLKPHAIDRNIRAGLFPRPFLIGVRAKGWDRDEVMRWKDERAADRATYADPAVPTPLSEAGRAARYEAARDAA